VQNLSSVLTMPVNTGRQHGPCPAAILVFGQCGQAPVNSGVQNYTSVEHGYSEYRVLAVANRARVSFVV